MTDALVAIEINIFGEPHAAESDAHCHTAFENEAVTQLMRKIPQKCDLTAIDGFEPGVESLFGWRVDDCHSI
ncbi:MAG: hypothetical protein ACO3AD_17640 [Burkholderiaceae bacterium]